MFVKLNDLIDDLYEDRIFLHKNSILY
jgi:hypothetical protein